MSDILHNIQTFFDGNTYFNVTTFIIATLAIIIAIYHYKKGKKEKKPIYITRSINLVKENINKINSVNILYQGKEVETLTITKLAFWNAGKETIHNNDIAPSDPVIINIDTDYKFLDAEIIFSKKEANNFNLIKIDDHKYKLDFDYIDYKQGAIIQLYHNANNSNSVQIIGTIKSCNNINRKSNKLYPAFIEKGLKSRLRKLPERIFRKTTGYLMLLVCILTPIGLYFDESFFKIDLFLIPKTLFIIIILGFYGYIGSRLINENVPRGLRIFHDEF